MMTKLAFLPLLLYTFRECQFLVNNCTNGTDTDCANRTLFPLSGDCHEHEYHCGSGECIHESWLCDKKNDCLDFSDELNCSISTTKECKTYEFRCNSGACVSETYRCDGHFDCDDSSDEVNCSETIVTNVECLSPNHRCVSKLSGHIVCINGTQLCDTNVDCEDGSDEGGQCDVNQCAFLRCQVSCQNTPNGGVCYCPKGMRLAIDGFSCTESQPCDEWGVCGQRCTPSKSSYTCDCHFGYYLDTDNFTCKSDDPSTPFVIFSNRHEIRSIDLRTSAVRPLISGLKNTIALDFYHSTDGDIIFWTDVVDDKIYRGSVIHGSLTNIEVVVQTGLETAEGLAVDWIGKNIYWVESNLDQIEVAKLNGSFRKTLVAGEMESPRAIALDPRYGVMFWTDWDSESPRIERSSMCGEGRTIIFRVEETDGAWPNGLTLDYMALRVYWIDARSDSIHSIKYDGNDHREILRGHDLLTHPFAIALFENYVYWTDWRTNSVIRANKWNGTDIKVIQRAITQPFDIQIYHSSRQPSSNVSNGCETDNGGCSHLCLLNVNNTFRCHCPHVMKLAADGRTCLVNEKVVLISRPNEIRGVDLENPYYHVIPPISLPKVIRAAQLEFDAKERRIYWADSQLNEVKRSNLTGSVVDTIIDGIIEHPFGFAFDWISRNVFITSQPSNGQAKLYVSNCDGEYIFDVITTGLLSPQSLAVDPFNGRLFWADHGADNSEHMESTSDKSVEEESWIAMSAMDGSNKQILTNTTTNSLLHSPSNLAFDSYAIPHRLYWVNVEGHSIQWIDLETFVVKTLLRDVGGVPAFRPFAVTVYNDQLYFSSQSRNSIEIVNKTNFGQIHTFRNQTEGVLSLRIYDKDSQNGTNPCSQNNGNCSHLCLPTSAETRVCRCAIGFQLDANNDTNCIGAEVFLLYSCNWGLKGVSQLPNETDDVKLPPISKVLMATKIDFSYDLEFIYWVDSDDRSINRIRRDTTRHEVIASSLEALEGIAVDWIAGNVYWIDSAYDVIEVSRLNGSNRYVVISGEMDKPENIVVDPIRGYIFWSDVGTTTVIERACLDGSRRQVLLNDSSEMTVNSLAVDLSEEKLYWTDSRSIAIERMDFDGHNREVVVKNNSFIKNPVSLTIYENFIYWFDMHYESGSILRVDKNLILSNSSNVEVIRSNLGDHVKDIQIYYKRPTSDDNPCSKNNGGCKELCLFRDDRSYRCACAHGMLAEDNRTCRPYEAFIMYSKVLEIDSIHLSEVQNLNSPYAVISNKENMRNVIGLTFDYKKQRIIYSDIQKGSINSVFFNGTNHTVIIEKQGSVEGIAYDSLYGDLYWTSNSDASITRLNMQRPKVEKIVKLMPDDKPRGIAVDSCASRVYWTNWNVARPSIQRSYLSGFDVHSIVTTDIRMPNAIALDHKIQKLFWSDARLDKIERCSLDGSERVVILSETPQHPFDVAVYGDFIFWTDWVAHAVFRANKYTGAGVTMLRRNVARPMGIIAVANDSDDCTLNPCLVLNGGCSDICTVSVNGSVVCKCNPQRVLLPDGERCVYDNIANCTDTQFECNNGHCIPFELTCDNVAACDDHSDEDEIFCATRRCPDKFFSCTNNRCIPHSKVCDGQNNCADSSDETNCTCGPDMFKCHTGPCIAAHYRCDHDPDCPDASDEVGCKLPDCSHHPLFWDPEQKFINCAHTTACIHPDWVCDGQNDCWDWSDERDCKAKSKEVSCPPNSFQCKSGPCIPQIWVCDRDNDCEDAKNGTVSSDEVGCSYGCQSDQFKCNNSDCIPAIWRCDGHRDCIDGSDESDECHSRKCHEGWFRCNSTGQCIPQVWVCDGENDCEDNMASDEHPSQGCNVNTCKPTEFQCNNFQCILQSYYCDGDDDCGDESDEPTDCVQHKCHENQFECKNKKCIAKTWICNGIDDCLDYSDESQALCGNSSSNSSHCGEEQFECENMKCIEASKLCDGLNDCGDYSDESRCNVNECESSFACAQKCEDMPIGYKCSCFDGFESSDGGRLCKDIDECRIHRPCSQHCRNSYGSYACHCAKGYYSTDGGASCTVNSGVKPLLLFSNRYFIRQVDFKGHDSHLKVSNLSNAVALDFDWEEKCVYWSDITSAGSAIKRLCEPSSGKPVEEIIHSTTVKSPDGLAVDWIGRNLYWVDKLKDTIEVSNLDGKFRKVLICDGLREPRAIVVDPFEGYMYWTDWGDNPYIGKATMDGSNWTALITESLGWPNALTIDYVTRELFWADAREDYIAVSDLNGQNRWIVATRKTSAVVNHIFAMTVFEDYLYWSDWETASIEKCHKYHCHNATKLSNVSHRPMDIKVYHSARQVPLTVSNPCNGSCTTLCLLRPGPKKLESVCTCQDYNEKGNPDGSNCRSNCNCDTYCLNGGTCNRTTEKKTCVCPEGYTGKRCEHDLCGCQNGGKCVMRKPGHYSCLCPEDFMGAHCDRFIPMFCNETKCKNGAECYIKDDRPHCNCTAGFGGYLCEIKLVSRNACIDYCFNGGNCSLPADDEMLPTCSCAKGWAGTKCQSRITCKGYCFNNGVCLPSASGNLMPSCLCRSGFTGDRCETRTLSGPTYSSPSIESGNSTWILVALIPIIVVFILALGIFVAVFVFRLRYRSRAFMHRRMEDNRPNVEIGNPVFGGNDMDDDSNPSDAFSGTFSIEVDEKSTNFTNPVYEYLEEEKRTLLIPKITDEVSANGDQN